MQTELKIRPGTPRDHAALLPLHRALYLDLQARILPPRVAALSAYRDFDQVLSDDLAGLLAGPPNLVFVADRGNDIDGYISGHFQLEAGRVLQRRALIEDWFVHEHARNQGLGRKLFEHFERAMRARGAEVLETTTWAAHAEARRRYASLGFDEVQLTLRRPLGIR